MPVQKRLSNAHTIEQVVAAVPRDRRSREIDDFIRQYYSQVDEEDLVERSISDLCGGALAHWAFMRRFNPGSAKLRVYNPHMERDGWESSHTIIEIVNDDMPFLVDSVTMEINRQGLAVYLTVHPVTRTKRDPSGDLVEILCPRVNQAGRCESLMRLEVDRRTDPDKLADLEKGILRILDDVRRAVEDHPKMKSAMIGLAATIRQDSPKRVPSEMSGEAEAFLKWLLQRNFIFLGFRDYELLEDQGEDVLRVVPRSGLGILRETGETRFSESFSTVAPEIKRLARAADLLVLTKANSRSTVHRPGYLDYVGIKRFDEKGQVIGERRFLGLYTFSAHSARIAEIPLLRRKLKNIVARSGFDPHGHMGKALVTVLEQHPRDELLQRTEDELLDDTRGIVSLGYRQRPRIFVRSDLYGRFMSCLVFLPRESYSAELSERVQHILVKTFNGVSSELSLHLSESALVRVDIIVRTKSGTVPEFDVREIEKLIINATRRWQDDLHAAFIEKYGEERGSGLFQSFGDVFPGSYQENSSISDAVSDVEIMDRLSMEKKHAIRLYHGTEAGENYLRLRVFHLGESVPLSSSLPMLEHMGVKVLEELNWEVAPKGMPPVYIHDYGMTYTGIGKIDVAKAQHGFEKTVASAWVGEIEDDDLNQLVLRANLDCREIIILRAYAKYLRQAGFPFSQAYMEQALCNNPTIAKKLVEMFLARFDPACSAEAGTTTLLLATEISHALDFVDSLDEDRMLRRFLAVIRATIRTNYFQTDSSGEPKKYLSLKFNSALLPDLPAPKPMFEIYVYSTRVEGVHLRGGKVARGGIRWSDRMEDFRTEILGLMKAQMVKNTVIVPVGSKGGFVLKRPPVDRESFLREGEECYKIFLRGLLDLTDNVVAGRIVPPNQVVRYDRDDPYLVVAADKGTSSFSDIANTLANEYGFWLSDAFASGGSVGYDHKKMGITARGAWESVKRHFHELGLNTQTTDFNVVGIGDMSGDVFGNGMLLSRHIRLLAAFDHRHIFLDPNPDAESSFRERERLFRLSRSSWGDYDRNLISQGGGVYARSAKSITITPEAKAFLGIADHALSPAELIRSILKAPVDLLYNGGIGTYVNGSDESHADVSDRANDAIRVNGSELHCKVVVEGGNLGCTQPGRIEFALNGGKINTDAIDNSAGVDCSDHEVNIKILLNSAVADRVINVEERNELLGDMTAEVGAMVLRDNYLQARTLSVRRSMPLDAQQSFLKYLEKSGRLNRELEFLPSDEELASRKSTNSGLSSPERAVLMAYSKISLYDELLSSNLSEDPYISSTIADYFPTALRERFRSQMDRHPLKREIIASQLTNEMINRVGSTFFHRTEEQTGAAPTDVVTAYLCTREIFDFASCWHEVDALDERVSHSTQSEILSSLERLLTRATLWFLRYRNLKYGITQTVHYFAAGVKVLAATLNKYLSPIESADVELIGRRLRDNNVPPALASRLAVFDQLYSALDIIAIAGQSLGSVDKIADLYFGVGARLDLPWLRKQIDELPAESLWQTLAKAALRDDSHDLQKVLTGFVETLNPGLEEPAEMIDAWESQYAVELDRSRWALAEIRSASILDLSMLAVAFRQLRDLGTAQEAREVFSGRRTSPRGNLFSPLRLQEQLRIKRNQLLAGSRAPRPALQ